MTRAAEAVVQDVVFERADDIDAAGEEFEGAGVERLDPARVDDRGADALRFELRGGFLGHLAHAAEAEEGDARGLGVPCLMTSALPISRSFGWLLGCAPVPTPRG